MSDKIKQYQKLLEEKTGTPTFCVLPWIHMATRPNGDMRYAVMLTVAAQAVIMKLG